MQKNRYSTGLFLILYPADPTDIVPVLMALVFQPETARQCASVNIMDDSSLEFDETFLVMLSTQDQAIVLDPVSATLTILNDDSK